MRTINRDQYGIIGQIQSNGEVEGGDSASWNGHYSYFSKDTKTLPFVKTFEVAFGGYVRHPHPHQTNNRFGAYYKNAWMGCMSRDQLTGVLLGIIAEKDYLALARFLLHYSLRGFLFSYNVVINGQDPKDTKFNLIKFFYNPRGENYYKLPDPTVFDFWATALRGFGVFSWIFWPILTFFDVQMLVSTLFVNRSDKDDKINYLGKLDVSRKIVPTPTSWLSAKILDRDNLKACIKKYWTGWRANPGMYDLHAAAIDLI